MHPPLDRCAATLAGGALAVLLLPLAPLTATAAPVVTVAPAAEAKVVAGGQSAGDPLFPTIGNTGYDVRHYGIALTYATDTSIKATTTIEAAAQRRLSSFSLDFEGLSIDRVRVDGKDAAFTRTGTKLVVTPITPAKRRFVVAVRYHGKPTTHIDPDGSKDGWVPSRTGATALSEPVGSQTWFPNNNTPRDKAAYDVALTVPKNLAAASNGVLRSKKTAHGTTTWRWRQRQPMATYLSLVAIGKFDVHRSTVKLQHGRKIPAWTFVDPSVGSTKEQRALLPKVLAFSEKQYGRYPFDATGMVIQDLGVGYALETQTRPFFDGPPDSSTLVHEVAHQWFGDSVSPKDWGDIWLNEGFASYAEDNWAAEHGGPTTWESFQATYDENDADAELWHPAPIKLTDPADLFSDAGYVRGRLTLEALRHKIGDAKMKSLLRTWATRHRSGTVRTSQFVTLAEKVSGQDLDVFFQVWLEVPAQPAGY